jgi:hypothetical protein
MIVDLTCEMRRANGYGARMHDRVDSAGAKAPPEPTCADHLGRPCPASSAANGIRQSADLRQLLRVLHLGARAQAALERWDFGPCDLKRIKSRGKAVFEVTTIAGDPTRHSNTACGEVTRWRRGCTLGPRVGPCPPCSCGTPGMTRDGWANGHFGVASGTSPGCRPATACPNLQGRVGPCNLCKSRPEETRAPGSAV